MPFAPWQQVIFNAAVAEIVWDLIGRAAIALWNREEVFHVPDLEIRIRRLSRASAGRRTFRALTANMTCHRGASASARGQGGEAPTASEGSQAYANAYSVIVAQADEYLARHRQQLIEEAAEMVRGSAELQKLYEKEQRERQRRPERNSKRSAQKPKC